MFEGAKDVKLFYEEGRRNGLTYLDMSKRLTMIDYRHAAYCDWILLKDDQ